MDNKNIKEYQEKNPVEAIKPEVTPEAQETQEQESAHRGEDLQKAREIVENMQVDDDVKMQTHTAAQNLGSLQEQEKLEQLLKLAKQKGVVFAVKTAQKMNDPYLLDMLHDTLAKNGLYKDFIK